MADETTTTSLSATPATPVSTAPAGPLTLQRVVLTAALTSLLTGAVLLVGYHRFVAPKVVTFDLRGYIGQLKDEVMTGKATQEQALTRLKNAADLLKAQPKNTVVLLGEVVLGDKTPKVPVADYVEPVVPAEAASPGAAAPGAPGQPAPVAPAAPAVPVPGQVAPPAAPGFGR